LVQTLIKHSYSSDSLQQASKTSTTQTKFYRSKLPSKQPSLPTSFSLNSISSSSNSAIYQLIWRDERERSFDELKGKLGFFKIYFFKLLKAAVIFGVLR